VAGVTLTLATGTGVTVIAAVPAIPSDVALMLAVPTATVVTSPVALTVATVGALLLHMMVRPVRTAPAASRGLAVSCCVVPSTKLAVAGVTLTLATLAGVTLALSEQAIPNATVAAATTDLYAQCLNIVISRVSRRGEKRPESLGSERYRTTRHRRTSVRRPQRIGNNECGAGLAFRSGAVEHTNRLSNAHEAVIVARPQTMQVV